jgi:hypothetical protein
MTLPKPKPPKLATWLLERLTSGYHNDPLAGDLIEEYGRGRSRDWYWRQVLIAILVSTKRTVAPRILYATRRVVFHLAAEVSAVIVIITLFDLSRRILVCNKTWTPIFFESVAFLAALGLTAFLWSRPRLSSGRRHPLTNYVVAVIAVVALGAGTLTWAAAVRSTCKTDATDACLCSKSEPITQAKH